ncbi:MAG: SHOCT domain-containing protein [Anaerolineaceae bacterium]
MSLFAMLVPLSLLPFLQMGWDGDHMDGWGWGAWVMMSILMVLFWSTVVVIVLWLVRSQALHSHPEGKASPLDLARERYARGEISHEEFERIRENLSRSG